MKRIPTRRVLLPLCKAVKGRIEALFITQGSASLHPRLTVPAAASRLTRFATLAILNVVHRTLDGLFSEEMNLYEARVKKEKGA